MENADLHFKGAAIVGMALSQIILGALERKKILTAQETDDALDGVLSGLENSFPGDDGAVQYARHIVEAIALAVLSGRRQQQSGNQ